MKQLEKEINISDKSNSVKRYKMYGTVLSTLIKREKDEVKKESNSHGV